MASINISLPDSLKEFLDEQVKKHGYSTVSAYMQELLRAAKRKSSNEHIDALLLKGLEGPSTEVNEAFWEKMHADLDAYIAEHPRTKK